MLNKSGITKTKGASHLKRCVMPVKVFFIGLAGLLVSVNDNMLKIREFLFKFIMDRRRGNPLFHYMKYGALEGKTSFPLPKIDPVQFQDFTFSMRSHWKLFCGYDKELYGKKIKMDESTLKNYQDLLVFTFIKDHIASGSRILDVGGGHSRILNHLANTHDCWNIDKFEGMGNGPKAGGNFNPELPDNSFDFVFSISALEHTPEDQESFDNIVKDINRVLKPGGYSLHLFDVLFKINGGMFFTNSFVHRIFKTVNTFNTWVTLESIKDNPDLYCMSETVYNKIWFHTTKREYHNFGRPASLNILWRKPL